MSLQHGIEAEEDRPTPFATIDRCQHLRGLDHVFCLSLCLAARCHASIASTMAHFCFLAAMGLGLAAGSFFAF